jgi:hypothetical protein
VGPGRLPTSQPRGPEEDLVAAPPMPPTSALPMLLFWREMAVEMRLEYGEK